MSRSVKYDVVLDLNKKYGQMPFCACCDRGGVLRFATGFRVIDKRHNLIASNLEPTCEAHSDKLRIETIPTKSSGINKNIWMETERLIEKTKNQNNKNGLPVGVNSSSKNDGSKTA